VKNLASESAISSLTSAPDAISLGLGLTNECNLSCAFCYRDPARTDRLSLEHVKSVLEHLPVRSVNLGTGENGMHPDFKVILAYLHTQPERPQRGGARERYVANQEVRFGPRRTQHASFS
jgi:hypothetical protein